MFMRRFLPDAMRASAAAPRANSWAPRDRTSPLSITRPLAATRCCVRSTSRRATRSCCTARPMAPCSTPCAMSPNAAARASVDVELPFPGRISPPSPRLRGGARTAHTDCHHRSHHLSRRCLLRAWKITGFTAKANVPSLIGERAWPRPHRDRSSRHRRRLVCRQLHKWLAAPKGCACCGRAATASRTCIPTPISHGYEGGYLAGVRLNLQLLTTPRYLAVNHGDRVHEKLGGAKLRARNIALAQQAGKLLAERFGTEVGNAGHATAMTMVRLPLGGPFTKERATAARPSARPNSRADAPLHAHPNRHLAARLRLTPTTASTTIKSSPSFASNS